MTSKDKSLAPRVLDFSEPLMALGFAIWDFTHTSPIDPGNMAFVYIPSRKYYEDASYQQEADEQFEQIRKVIVSNSVAVVDLREILSAADYYEYDGHWTPAGHRKAAAALVDFLKRTERISGMMPMHRTWHR
jgi:hypothetical protein